MTDVAAAAAARVTADVIADWVTGRAVPLTTVDPEASLADLEPLRPMVGDAVIAGIGGSTYGAHEQFALTQRIMRFLVEELGFRSVATEDDWDVALDFDEYIRTGTGDLDALAAGSGVPWRIEEIRAAVAWLRAWNAGHPGDEVRFFGAGVIETKPPVYEAILRYASQVAPERVADLERELEPIRPTRADHVPWFIMEVKDKERYVEHAHNALRLAGELPHPAGDRQHDLVVQHARQIVAFYEHYAHHLVDDGYRDEQMAANLHWWHEHTGHKIVYWSTIAHSACAPRLTVAVPPRGTPEFAATGAHLRQRYGHRYISIGLTYDQGTVNSCWAFPPFSSRPVPTAALPAGFTEHPLARLDLPQFALDLRVSDSPSSIPSAVQEWLHGPARTRIIGSIYDPELPADQFYMTGGSLAEWFDVLIHQGTVTPSRVLASAVPDWVGTSSVSRPKAPSTAAAVTRRSGANGANGANGASEPDWAALQSSIDGQVVLPGDAGYPLAHDLLYSEQWDSIMPQAIVFCGNSHDVRETIGFTRRYGIHTVPRGGGHSPGGYSTTSGVVLDVSRMNSVTVDAEVATIGGGTKIVEASDALFPYNLSIPTGRHSTIGVAGIALGGGIGPETRMIGTLSDRMLGAEIVLADGTIVQCDENHHPDLFWALRGGGGGNFGVVTSLTVAAVPARTMTSYALMWPQSSAAAVFDAWQRWAPFQPGELSSNLFTALMGTSSPGASVLSVFGELLNGSGSDVNPLIEQFVGMAGTDPSYSSVREMSYRDGMFDIWRCNGLTAAQCQVIGQNPDAQLPRLPHSVARGNFVERFVPGGGIEVMVAPISGEATPNQIRALSLQSFGGAVNRIPPTQTAFVHRNSLFLATYAVNTLATPSEADIQAANDWTTGCWEAMQPWASPYNYQNAIDPMLTNWREAYYGINYPRLAEVKNRYDPDRFFRFPQAIG